MCPTVTHQPSSNPESFICKQLWDKKIGELLPLFQCDKARPPAFGYDEVPRQQDMLVHLATCNLATCAPLACFILYARRDK